MHGYQSRNFYHSETDQVPLAKAETELDTIFKEHIGYLEEWSLLDRDHSNSLLGATDSLKPALFVFQLLEKM
ncbi:hypothetical protein Bca101_020308 [Brassica carinata]